MELFGDFTSTKTQNIMIVFEKCDIKKQSKCKSSEEIAQALEYTYLLIVDNEETYQHE